MATEEHNNLPPVVSIGRKEHPAITAVVNLMHEMSDADL
jgi:hypothetical protein